MRPFAYTSLPVRVVFGTGTLAQVGDEVLRLGCARPFVVTGAHHATIAEGIAAHGRFAGAAMHTPVDVTMRALAALQDADCVIAVGGGSAIGLAKAIALRTGLPQIAVPTTYAGSEATPVLGQTEAGRKTTVRDLAVLPEVIVYDVELTLGMPRELSMTSGLNAMAHAVESLYAHDGNPVTAILAEQALATLAGALPRIHTDPGDRDARGEALFGAWACGTCLGTVGMALHHKLCHVLGGSFGLPHAETHAVMLPYSVAYNAAAAPDAMARVARALGGADAANGLRALAEQLGAPIALQSLGMIEQDLDRAADLATAAPYPNPRPVERAPIRALLGAAFAGTWPS
jgi:maleylacetate reductase